MARFPILTAVVAPVFLLLAAHAIADDEATARAAANAAREAGIAVGPEDEEKAQALIQSAREAARQSGIELPEIKEDDVNRLLKKLGDELDKNRGKKDSPEKNDEADAKTEQALAALPAWIPPVPGFTPGGPGTYREGKKSGVGSMKGSSSESPTAIADAWERLDGMGYSSERVTRRKDKQVSESVRLLSAGKDNQWAEVVATPGGQGNPTNVHVRFGQPLAAAAGESATTKKEAP